MSILSFGGALGLGMSAISLWLSFLVAAKLKRGELVAKMNFIPQKIDEFPLAPSISPTVTLDPPNSRYLCLNRAKTCLSCNFYCIIPNLLIRRTT